MGDGKRYSLAELAAAAGMTARNVRAYQTRGLIEPPLRAGRRTEYTRGHLERLRWIRAARARGATLALIEANLTPDGRIDLTRFDDGRPASGRPPRQARRKDLSPLLGQARVDDTVLHAVVDSLVSAGLLARTGRRVLAGRDVVAALTALYHRHGLPVDVGLRLALRAAESAAALSTALTSELATLVSPRGPAVVDQVTTLASGVLRVVLADGLAEGAAPAKGRA